MPIAKSDLLATSAPMTWNPILRLDPEQLPNMLPVESREGLAKVSRYSFACWKDGRIHFGTGDRRSELSPNTQPGLQSWCGNWARIGTTR